MATETERLAAAQAKADEVIATVAEAPEGARLLRVTVTDVDTDLRLAVCFVNYQTDRPRLVGGEPW